MLSSLITTFLCAVAIGSVSGAFLAFDPDPISFEDIEAPNSFSVQLKSKPTEEVIVYFEHPFLPISDCVIVFDPNNWNAPRPMTLLSTRDIGVQVFLVITAELSCIKKVLARYGSFVMSLDVSGPVKNISEYSVTKVTQNDNGLRYTPVAKAGGHKIDFPYGSELYLKVLTMMVL
ncbi:hypothetical protein BASA81_017075 [Batrachochytrium salamandrivorans]|nr:hypothetical protein BASA81_017075 [Batrachochytrium salamandrivorans]